MTASKKERGRARPQTYFCWLEKVLVSCFQKGKRCEIHSFLKCSMYTGPFMVRMFYWWHIFILKNTVGQNVINFFQLLDWQRFSFLFSDVKSLSRSAMKWTFWCPSHWIINGTSFMESDISLRKPSYSFFLTPGYRK